MVWRCITVIVVSDLHISEGAIDAEVYVRNLERHQEVCGYFSRMIPDLILQDFQQRGFKHTECVCLTGLPAITENVWSIMQKAIRQQQPLTFEQVKSWTHQEWTEIALKNYNQNT